MTARTTLALTPEPTPLADFLTGVLKRLRPLPPLELDLTRAAGEVLAQEVRARNGLPAFDRASIDGYAARWADVVGAGEHHPIRLSVVGDLAASSWRPVRVTPGTCFSVAAGAPMPAGADVVIAPGWTDQGMATVEVRRQPKRGHGVRRAGDEVKPGAVVGAPGAVLTPALLALLAAAGVDRVTVRPHPRVAVIAAGDELVEPGRPSAAGQVVDANSYSLAAAAAEAGAQAYRVGICGDDPERLRSLLDEQLGRADLIVVTGGTGTGPGDIVRRVLGPDGPVRFTELSLFPCTSLGYGALESVPVVCLPGDTGAALIGFEVLVRPLIRTLAGAEPIFRPSVRAHLLETLTSPLGLREFRPAHVTERRGGGYTVAPLAGGPYTLSGMALANGLLVLGERVGNAPAGSTVDVLLLDRRR